MTSDGTNTLTYDAIANLTSDGVNTHTWDRANRLLSVDSHSYAYDGDGRRIQQTVSSIVTDYLLDTQPGLALVLAETTGANTTRYVHSPRGIHAQEDPSGIWTWPLQDGLGSVRSVASGLAVNGMQHYAPYGEPFGTQGSLGMPFGFTGEQTDGNGLVYLRARHYTPNLGIFPSLDPFEGDPGRPMSLNGYMYVEGNTLNMVDPGGESPDRGEMERSDKFRYSCKCGWLDAAHIDFGVPLGMEALVNWQINWSLFPNATQDRMRAIYPWFITATGVNFGNLNAVIDEKHPDYIQRPNDIALGIWMETHEELERKQGEPPVSWVSDTSFSIEDLVSDIVGYAAYRAQQSWVNSVPSGELLGSIGAQADYSPTWKNAWLQQECGLLTKQQSLDMLDRFEKAGGFPKNPHWTPLPLPAGVSNPYCNSDVTVEFRNTSMYHLLTTAIPSHSRAWWWDYSNGPISPSRLKVAYVDHRAREWELIERHLYVVLPSVSRC